VETYRDAGLGLLGDPTRRAIFERLARHPCSAGELAQHLPISRPAVSQHLRVLNDGSLVVPRAEGTKEDVVHASIIDMTLRLPVDDVLFDELRTDFLPRVSQHPGFRGLQYVLAERGGRSASCGTSSQRTWTASPSWSVPGFRTTSRHAWRDPRPPCAAVSSST
jgi:DNA-binding transcriptional ArsR family regulator